jgi:kumamolisin
MVESKDLKPVPGSERAPLASAKEVGPSDPNEVVEVTVVVRSKGSEAQMASTREMSAKPLKERRYLSREELAAASAPDPDDIAAIEQFAHEHGLTVVKVSPETSSVFLSGTVEALSEAFGTKLSVYEGPTGRYRGRVGPVHVPAELAPVIVAVLGLDNRQVFRPHSIRRKEGAKGVTARAEAVSYTPPQLAQHYNFPTGLDGSGQCIAIIELGGGYKAKDINEYFTKLGTTPPTVVPIAVDGARNKPGSDADGEVALDIEVAGAVAPKAKIAVYFAPNTDKGFLDAINAAVNDKNNDPKVISISWGSSEDQYTPQAMQAMDLAFQAAGGSGISVFAAAGDNGSSDNVPDNLAHVDYPASSPYVTGCGGTSLASTGEVVWNDGPNGGATGGGVSDVYPVPDWQTNANVPPSANPGGKPGRGVPDVAGDADPNTGYEILLDGKEQVIGGTSAVAPLWAGLTALINQQLPKRVGFLNPLLYTQLATADVFNDIISGNNGFSNIPCYEAGPGWDPCTGFGTPDGVKLLQALSAL